MFNAVLAMLNGGCFCVQDWQYLSRILDPESRKVWAVSDIIRGAGEIHGNRNHLGLRSNEKIPLKVIKLDILR